MKLCMYPVADLERRGSGTGARSASEIFWVATPTFRHAGSPNLISRNNSRPSQMSRDQ